MREAIDCPLCGERFVALDEVALFIELRCHIDAAHRDRAIPDEELHQFVEYLTRLIV